MPAGFIHFFQAPGAARWFQLQGELLRHGLGLSLHEQIDALCTSVDAAPEAIRMPRLVLLAATHELNHDAARALRGAGSQVCIAMLAAQLTDDTLLQAMHAGIDVCWPLAAPAPTIAAALLRLAESGGGRHPPGRHAQASLPGQSIVHHGEALPRSEARSYAPAWKLVSRAWTVLAPDGTHIELTTTERMLMRALYEAPGWRLSHQAMMQLLDQAADRGPQHPAGQGPVTTRRLSVLMSRLRRKFVDAASETPFRSVRGLGYELCVDFVAAYGPEPTDWGALGQLDEPAPSCPDA